MYSALLKACAAAAVGLASLAAAPAVFAQPADGGAVAGVCRNVLGLEPGEKHFAACVESLSRSVQTLPQSPRMGGDAPAPGGTRSYFVISREAAFERDRQACVRLGFDPRQEAFGACVTDLKAALSRASEPAM